MSDVPPESQTPQQLREFAERQQAAAEKANAELETLRAENRKNALLAAGVDTSTPLGQMFDKAYDGELVVDVVKEAWTAIAPTAPAPTTGPATTEPPAVDDDGPSAEELAQAAQRQALNTGGTPPGDEPTPAPWPAALSKFRGAREEGQTTLNAQRGALQEVINAAAAGDERVIFDATRWRESQGQQQ